MRRGASERISLFDVKFGFTPEAQGKKNNQIETKKCKVNDTKIRLVKNLFCVLLLVYVRSQEFGSITRPSLTFSHS